MTLELGGKSPLIVFGDADIDAAVAAAISGAFLNMGQNCNAASRTYVEASIYNDFIERAIASTKKIVR